MTSNRIGILGTGQLTRHMKKNVFSGVPVCHDFKGVLKGKMRTGIWVTWTKIVGGRRNRSTHV